MPPEVNTENPDGYDEAIAAYRAKVEALDARTITVPEGCLWEGPAFEIRTEVVVSSDPCRHCRKFDPEPRFNAYERILRWRDQWVCPRAVLAENEGGFATTAVCLDCILAAAEAK